MTNLLPRLAALPELRAAAEAETRAYLAAFNDIPPAVLSVHGTTAYEVHRRTVEAHLSRLLDPTNPAAEGVLADIYRRATGRESATASPTFGGDTTCWVIWYIDHEHGAARLPSMVDVPDTKGATRYEAWARALIAHYDTLAGREKTA